MPDISPRLISDKLVINHNKRPIRQKRRAYDPEKYVAMKNEVLKLHSIDFIKEVDYPSWLANVIMVQWPKKGWHMCVDYTNLNCACPKDIFPLPRINQLVDAITSHELLRLCGCLFGVQPNLHAP